MATLKEMGVLDRKPGAHGGAFISKPAVMTWMASNRVHMSGPVDESAFVDQSEGYEIGE